MSRRRGQRPSDGRPDGSGRSYAPRVRLPKGAPGASDRSSLLDVTGTLAGKKLVVIGGTGFLGKVLVSMLLKKYPDLGHLYLMVRPKPGLSPEERFLTELWPSPCFDPVREGMSDDEAERWVHSRVTPILGDVTSPRVGIDDATFARLKEEGIDAVLNVAGVVSFTPPIDEAFEVNALGVLNLVGLCKELNGLADDDDAAGAVPLLHTSTAYVAGYRIGEIPEEDPRLWPFPKCDELDRFHWDPRRELEQGLEISRHVRARADDGQLTSLFEDAAREKLRARHQPTTGEPYKEAVRKERDRYLDDKLVEEGSQRSAHWGWPNTYTYTKAVGEQLLADSGVPFCIVRPTIVESSLAYPVAGWNEGINTSAPLIYMALHGQVQYPSREGHKMDFIPVDHVCAGLVLCTAALLVGEHSMVHHLGTSDANAFTMHRLIEVTGLAKRRYMRSRRRGNPLLNRVYARVQPHPVTPEVWQRQSAPAMRKAAGALSQGLKALKKTPLAPVTSSLEKTVSGLEKQLKGSEIVMRAFLPFISELNYTFRADNTRALYARCNDVDRAKLAYTPHELDWRTYLLEVHIPGLRKWVFPHLEARLFKRPRAEERFSDLLAFLDEIADREGGRVALQQLSHDDSGANVLVGISYRDLKRRAHACAARLADVGVHPGDRVALVAKNAPEWGVGFFGILAAGASVVPLDPALDADEIGRRITRVGAEYALLGPSIETVGEAACLDLNELAEPPPPGRNLTPPEVWVSPDDVALIPFTAGTTGDAKPVVLTHKNITAVLASVAPLFKIGRRDSGLSVLPLHQTFELTCGLLLPLLRGAHVTYVDELSAEQLSDAFQAAGITAMIGVPQVWEELEDKIYDELSQAGPFAEAAFQAGLTLNRTLGKALGVNLGRVLFRPIHDRLGGRIRFMVSTGGHLPKRTADTFKNLGIELRQGYGLTEAAPVVTLGDSRGRTRPLPGIEVEVRDVTEDGVGEIVTRGDHVMLGYLDDDVTTQAALGKDGWLRTGDLGRVDKDGRISVVARHNEVITLRDGKRVYPRGIEEKLAALRCIDEAAVVGIPDGQGGERVAALLVADKPAREPDEDGGQYRARLNRVLEDARRRAERELRTLEEHERPRLVELTFEPLPRTVDRKVKRPDVLAFIIAAQTKLTLAQEPAKQPSEVIVERRELSLPRGRERLAAPGQKKRSDDVKIPESVGQAVRDALLVGQMGFYGKGLKATVSGEQYVPHNRQTIVVANHASHLDMGLIKYALGSYGKNIVALAAKDYFFEGKWRRTYFENFTNLRPLDRADNPREAMREASGLIERGETILLFPEGTRTATGEMGEFRPAAAYLALKHGVDILPVFVDGTYRSMPRGSFIPRNRKVGVRIGPPLSARDLLQATEAAGLRMSTACQKVSLVMKKAIEALRDERRFSLEAALDEVLERAPRTNALTNGKANGRSNGAGSTSRTPENPLEQLFKDLETRFCADEVKQPVTYYFSLGQGPETKWTVQVRKDGCLIVNGKLDGAADCVMKTDVGMFTRIIKDHYIPQVSEFLDGTVKTNDPELLTTFVQVFNL